MTILTESKHTGEHIINEIGGSDFCREQVSLAHSGDIEAGAVLGVINASFTATIAAADGNDGNADISAVAVTTGADVQEGDYVLKCTAASEDEGTFSVTAPDGTDVGDLTVASAFSSTHVSLTLPDGDTDWAVGDTVIISVVGADQYVEFDPGTRDGRHIAKAINLYPRTLVDGTPVNAVVSVRNTLVNSKSLSWGSDVTAAQKAQALRDLKSVGIVALA